MILRTIIILFCLATPALASTAVFQNTCPAQARNDPTYLANLANLRAAIASGSRMHASLQLPENGAISQFYVEFTAIKIESDYASGILGLRPVINNDAQATAMNGLVAGSIDTLGVYYYGAYQFGTTQSGATNPNSCYVVTWWAE